MPETTDDRPGPGWHNICRECFGCLIEWPGMRRCECEQEKRRSVTKDAISQTTEDRADRYEEALQRIVQWADAYPLDIFPEPDFKRAHEVLTAAGITLDAISASCMRHVVAGVGKIAREALS